MRRRVLFRARAEADLLEARAWYDEQETGLGAQFVTAAEITIDQIAETPLAFPRAKGETRRAILRRFPYAVYFRLHGEDVIILAIVHGRRHPDHWRSRR